MPARHWGDWRQLLFLHVQQYNLTLHLVKFNQAAFCQHTFISLRLCLLLLCCFAWQALLAAGANSRRGICGLPQAEGAAAVQHG
jgi:hypothetical protein